MQDMKHVFLCYKCDNIITQSNGIQRIMVGCKRNPEINEFDDAQATQTKCPLIKDAEDQEKIRVMLIEYVRTRLPMAVTFPEADNYGDIWVKKEGSTFFGGYAGIGVNQGDSFENLSMKELFNLVRYGATENTTAYSRTVQRIEAELEDKA